MKFLPNKYYKNIYEINYKLLRKQGIKCLLFDLDNTSIPYKEKNPSDDLIKLYKKLSKDGFKVVLFTNASSKRIRPFKELNIDVDYSCNSLKPLTLNYKKIIKKYGYNASEVCIIGDQIYTDILGGNRVGIYTILVSPLSDEDLFITKILRFIEAKTLNYYEKKGLFKRGEYDE